MNQGFKKYIVHLFTLLEWILFFGLLVCSIVFTWDVVEKYNSKDTLFIQNEGKTASLPVITICFSETEVNRKYQKDFNIAYSNDDKIIKFNFRPIFTIMNGVCYELKAKYESIQNQLYQIKIKSEKYVLPTMEFHFTSE